MTPKIYFIIITYNAMKWAERCFSSLRKSSVPVNCIVVDNGSTDGTQEYIKTLFPEVDFIQSEENLGFGKANNIGIEKAYKAGAEFFYLMNQDAWIFENSVEELLKVYDNYPDKDEIGILSPMHLDGSEKMFDKHFEIYLSRNTGNNRLISDYVLKKVKTQYELDFVNAAHWMIPCATIEIVGGFNPYFFHGAEDYDYKNRVAFFARKTLIATSSFVVHDAKQEYVEKDPQKALIQKRESMIMQRETRYMNPLFDFNQKTETKEFQSNIIKLAIKGRLDESRFYARMYSHFKKNFKKIEKYRAVATNSKHAFLNI